MSHVLVIVGDSPAEPIVGIVTRLAQGRVFLTKVHFNIIPCYYLTLL
jgi:hypothetical protein